MARTWKGLLTTRIQMILRIKIIAKFCIVYNHAATIVGLVLKCSDIITFFIDAKSRNLTGLRYLTSLKMCSCDSVYAGIVGQRKNIFLQFSRLTSHTVYPYIFINKSKKVSLPLLEKWSKICMIWTVTSTENSDYF